MVLMQRFIDGVDWTPTFVARIEQLVRKKFSDSPIYEILDEDLALYEPFGGEDPRIYTNKAQLAAKFQYVIDNFLQDDKIEPAL